MKFHIFSRRTLRGRRWFFNARANNGEIVLQSEAYKQRQSAQETVALIRTEARAAPVEFGE